MHFGKYLKSHKFQPWIDQYLDYDSLKTILERDEKAGNAQDDLHLAVTDSSRRLAQVAVSLEFASLLDEEVEKVISFFLQQQGSIAQRLYQLRQEHKKLLAEDAMSSSLPQCSSTLYERYHAIAVELLHLIHYVDLNMTGIRKILKKHDKITGKGLSSRYLIQGGAEDGRPFLSPLFEQGGIDALAMKLEDSFDELYMYQQQTRPGKRYLRSDTTPDDDVESKRSIQDSSTPVYNTYHGGLSSLASNMSSLHGEHILREIKNARQKMKETRDFVHILAAQMLMIGPEEEEEDSILDLKQTDLTKDRKRRISNLLNFVSTFLHLTDYYIVAPGCGTYAEKLGGSASLAGMIIGMNSVAALISTVLYSWWTSRSYKAPLMCATTCQILGGIIYAMALPVHSLKFVMLGRLVSGFGSARALNRRYIADTYPARERTAASAAFVTAGALGTSAGPAFAALLYFAVSEDSDQPYWQVENAPCWLMTVVWSIYLILVIYFFEEPTRSSIRSKKSHLALSNIDEDQALLHGDSKRKEATTDTTPKVPPLWKNVAVMSTFGIYFCLKFILESLLSSTATLTDFYFDWDGSVAGWYLAILGFLVLPANWAVALVCKRYDDRELILAIEIGMLAGCLAILKYAGYTVQQYVFGSVLIFVSTNALEGPSMSLLSKTIPAVYSRGLFNVGLLATEAGTLGRAVGDVILTVSGANGLKYVLNNAFGTMSALSFATIAMTWQLYDYLEPIEKDD